MNFFPLFLSFWILPFTTLFEINNINNEPVATIQMTNISKFKPKEITISTGDIVRWENTSIYVCTFPGHYVAGMKGRLIVQ
jgi:plastocyanin